jgi:predicted dithiol-disulfide oxidoreductase (DUF899 family)
MRALKRVHRQQGRRTMQHTVVSAEEWIAARKRLLAKEKEFTRLRDELTAQRLALPWEKVEKSYVFDGPNGRETLADLFSGRSQLLVTHFMFGPDWEQGCVGCSFGMDHLDPIIDHLAQKDVTCVAVSRAPYAKIAPFKKRMGWRIKWVSSHGSDFNFDFHVSFTPEEVARGDAIYNYERGAVGVDELSGRSVFYRDEAGAIFHTYSSFGRGGEDVLGTYRFLDIVPKGRAEAPGENLSDWVRHHDRYQVKGA